MRSFSDFCLEHKLFTEDASENSIRTIVKQVIVSNTDRYSEAEQVPDDYTLTDKDRKDILKVLRETRGVFRDMNVSTTKIHAAIKALKGEDDIIVSDLIAILA